MSIESQHSDPSWKSANIWVLRALQMQQRVLQELCDTESESRVLFEGILWSFECVISVSNSSWNGMERKAGEWWRQGTWRRERLWANMWVWNRTWWTNLNRRDDYKRDGWGKGQDQQAAEHDLFAGGQWALQVWDWGQFLTCRDGVNHFYIDSRYKGNLSRFFNHSDDPNLLLKIV